MFLALDEAALLSLPTITRMWAVKGQQPIIPMNYGRQERKTLFGAVNLKTGSLTGQIVDTGNAKTFQKFLDVVRIKYPRGLVIMILDNVRFHHAKTVQRYRMRYPRIQFLFLPPIIRRLMQAEDMVFTKKYKEIREPKIITDMTV